MHNRPFLSGLPGAETTQEITGVRGVAAPDEGDQADGPIVREIVIVQPDGSVLLVSQTGRDLMSHIQRTLAEGEQDVFLEQVLSEATKQEFEERGHDPARAYEFLKLREKDIAKLFARMPNGEFTPGVMREKVGWQMFRVRLTGLAARDLAWTSFDMVLEEGQWRLRWFG